MLHAASGSGFGNGIRIGLQLGLFNNHYKNAVDNKGLTQGTKQSTAHSLICEALITSSGIGAFFYSIHQSTWATKRMVLVKAYIQMKKCDVHQTIHTDAMPLLVYLAWWQWRCIDMQRSDTTQYTSNIMELRSPGLNHSNNNPVSYMNAC